MRDMRLISTPQSHMNDYLQAAKAHETPVVIWDSLLRLKNYKAVQDVGLKVCLNGQGSDEVFMDTIPWIIGWVFSIERNLSFDTQIC